MRYKSIIVFLVLLVGGVFSCKKWEDPASVENPQIANPYCNDPDAVNYNWGFPGKPDNSVCYYAPDIFAGTYLFRDSIYKSPSDLFLSADSMVLTISKISNTQMAVVGFCPAGKEILFSSREIYTATADTTVGDSLTVHSGQFFCRPQDTLMGTLTRDKVDSFLIYVSFTVYSDTGITIHSGRAIKNK